MSDKLTTTKQPPSLEDRYRLFNRLIDAALFKFHPDTYRGNDPDKAQRLTQKLLVTKRRARKVYGDLTK